MVKTKGLRMHHHPIAYDQIKLCDITLDIENPWNDCTAFPANLDDNDIFVVDEDNLEAIGFQGSQANAEVQLVSFLSVKAKSSSQDTQAETVGKARCYRIRNSGEKFKQACRDPKVREWLTEYHIKNGLPAYMIVGLYTYQDARVAKTESMASGISGKGGAQSLRVAGEAATEGRQGTIFTTTNEIIFAMEYRKLKKQWLSTNIDKAMLEQGNRWEIFWGMRSKVKKGSEDDRRIVDIELIDEEAEDINHPENLFDVDEGAFTPIAI